jgi:hypothetical protein
VSNDRPESGRARFLEALQVRKHAIRGFGFATVVTVLVYVGFVVLPGGNGLDDAVWYLGLGLSLLLALGALVTTVLVALQARRLVKEL